MKLGKDLREFIELLNSRKVDYIVVGGHAVAPFMVIRVSPATSTSLFGALPRMLNACLRR